MKSKMSCIANPMIPASNLLPDIVCVLPDPLWPYANTVPIQTRIIKYYIVKVCVLFLCICARICVFQKAHSIQNMSSKRKLKNVCDFINNEKYVSTLNYLNYIIKIQKLSANLT